MNKKADALKEKIAKLNQKLRKVEEKQEMDVAKLLRNITKKGIDIRILAGMIINAEKVLKTFEKESGVWQQVGEKFLFKSKNKSAGKKDK
jgi:hypothetical protein